MYGTGEMRAPLQFPPQLPQLCQPQSSRKSASRHRHSLCKTLLGHQRVSLSGRSEGPNPARGEMEVKVAWCLFMWVLGVAEEGHGVFQVSGSSYVRLQELSNKSGP